MATGNVLRFDETQGYGFIAPDDGSVDVFVHANDLLDSKSLFRPGQRVSYQAAIGERGPKASEVRIIGAADGVASGGGRGGRSATGAAARVAAGSDDSEDGLCDLLSAAEMQHEVTEALLVVVPPLSAEQILQARSRILALARGHNWIES